MHNNSDCGDMASFSFCLLLFLDLPSACHSRQLIMPPKYVSPLHLPMWAENANGECSLGCMIVSLFI